ncbi:MAG: hypothetical protein PHC84_02075 [Clostridia bacterium]|nr:hypothetical protein [Clostridia bacterium]
MIRINCDLFDIADRLREIDEGYTLMYNTRRQRFEIHRQAEGRVSYELTLPYDRLDARSVEFCRKTRKERAAALLREIDEANKALEKRQLYDTKKEAERRTEELLSSI